MVHKKHTGCDNLARGNLFHGGVMYIPWACICCCWLLIVLLGVRALPRPMTSLVAIETWLIVRWCLRVALSYTTLRRQSNRVCPTIPFICLAWLGLLLRWLVFWSRWAVLGSCHHQSSLLRCTGFKGPLAALGCSINIIMILLCERITHEFVVGLTLVICQSSSTLDLVLT